MIKKLMDIDAEFDDVYFDEESINRTTGLIRFFQENPDQLKLRNVAISKSKKGVSSPFKGKTRPWKGKPRVNKSVEYHTEESKAKIRKTKEEKNIALGINKKIKIKNTRRKFQTGETKNKISKSIIELQGIKCFVINPNGIKFEFNTIKECELTLGYQNLTPNAINIFPVDGTLKVMKRGKWKNWSFGRIV